MAEAYATFAARGLHCHSRPVTEILDSAGNQIRDYASQCAQVMQQSTADAVNDVLRGVIEGGFASAQALDQPAAGKTGTTQEGKSVWFVGYTPQLAAAAMIGGANALGVADRRSPARPSAAPTSPPRRAPASRLRSGATRCRSIDDFLDYEDFVYPSTVEGAGETSAGPPPASASAATAAATATATGTATGTATAAGTSRRTR